MEKEHEIWYVECEEPVKFRVTYESNRIMSDIKLDILGVLEVGWEKCGTVRTGDYIFSLEQEKKVINWVQNIWYNIE